MDFLTLPAALLGALLAFATGVFPGLHLNTLAPFAPLSAARGGLLQALLLGAFGASAFAGAFAAIFLAPTTEEGAAARFPAERLLAEGRGVEAAEATALGLLSGILVALLAAALFRAPFRDLRGTVQGVAPLALLAIAVILVLSETRRVRYARAFETFPALRGGERVEGTIASVSPARLRLVDGTRILDDDAAGYRAGQTYTANGRWTRVEGPFSRALGWGLALLALAAAGAVGLLAFRLGARSPLGLPATPLLPLLAGLFGLPSLLAARESSEAPVQVRSRARLPWARLAVPSLRALAAGALVGFLPALSPAVAATATAARSEDDAVRGIFVAAVATGAAAAFSVVAWTEWGATRAGALAVASRWGALSFSTAAPAFLFGAWAGYILLLAAARRWGAMIALRRRRALALVGALLVVAIVALFTGPVGLLVLAAATCVGFLPAAWRIRKAHLMGAILVPVLLHLWFR